MINLKQRVFTEFGKGTIAHIVRERGKGIKYGVKLDRPLLHLLKIVYFRKGEFVLTGDKNDSIS